MAYVTVDEMKAVSRIAETARQLQDKNGVISRDWVHKPISGQVKFGEKRQ